MGSHKSKPYPAITEMARARARGFWIIKCDQEKEAGFEKCDT
jgi:hypothetical protein